MNCFFAVLLISLMTGRSFSNRLPCQQVRKVKYPRAVFVKPDSCCSSFPYNSGLKMCCLGAVVDTKRTRCCLSGHAVPIEARCDCYPNSPWISRQVTVIKSLEIQFASLVELLDTAKQRLEPIIEQHESLIEELDTQANELYRLFLDKINMTTDPNPEEINNIINLIIFRNAMEEQPIPIEPVQLKKAWEDDINEEEVVNKTRLVFQQMATKLMQENIFVNYLLKKKKAYTKTLIERDRAEIEELVKQRVDAIPSSTYAEIDKIVVRRLVIQQNLSQRTANLEITKKKYSALVRLLAIAKVDHELTLATLSFLDETLEEVLLLEQIAREEDEEIKEYLLEESTLKTTEETVLFTTSTTTSRSRTRPFYIGSDFGAEPLNDEESSLDFYLDENEEKYVEQSSEGFFYEEKEEEFVLSTHSPEELNLPKPAPTVRKPNSRDPSTVPGCNVNLWNRFVRDLSYRADLMAGDMLSILSSNHTVNTVEELTEQLLQEFKTTKTEIAFSRKVKPPNDYVSEVNWSFEELHQLVNNLQRK